MLVAYGPDGRPVVAEETPLELLQQWSRTHALHCPNCRGVMHVRGGPEKRMQLHFAHQRGECAWSTETESVRHARGKLVLAHWLQEQFPQGSVMLERRLPEPNRIADIFVTHADGQQWAVEFQCAPLDLEEWQHRHRAYRKANILDIWIIGDNRREKQEAFIEAVIATAHEILFLDPQITPPKGWLRWPITRNTAQQWQESSLQPLQLDGWVGHFGYGATLSSSLQEISLDEHGNLHHPVRTTLETYTRLRSSMHNSSLLDASLLTTYLRYHVGEEAVRIVIAPLLRAYLRDPDLLKRYNYGRGPEDHLLSATDMQRVQKAKAWIQTLAQNGYTVPQLQALKEEIPFVGPYAAFVKYMEMLVALGMHNT